MDVLCRLGGLAACVLLPVALMACASTERAAKRTEAVDFEKPKGENKSAPAPELLVPWQTFTGGRLVTKLDANGFPMPGAVQGFKPLVAPSAVAVRGADIYIADSGVRKLYRVDTVTQTMSVVPDIVAMPWTQMQVGTDLSLYVLDPMRQTILHYSRGMQPLQSLGDPYSAISLNGFVLDVPLGQIIASDQISQRLVMFSPLGGSALPLNSPVTGEFRALGALASDGRTIYAVDGACFCIAAMDETGRVKERIGSGVLAQPQALAADRHGLVFVADAADRTLKVFLRGELVANYRAQALRLVGINALAIDEDILYIADTAGSRVLSFRIQAPMEERQ